MTFKNIMKQILMILAAAVVVFLLFYNCTGKKTEEQNAELKKDTVNKTNSVYTNDCRTLYLEARKNDSLILMATDIDPSVGNAAIKAFTEFSFYCDNDSLAPMFLLKAGQIAGAIHNLPQAQLSFEKVIKDFPKYRDRGAAMFLLAQMYDEPGMLNDEEKAKQLYIEIINSYPGTDWSNNARASMDLLGKTDEQIIREFEKKNQKK